MPDAQIDNNENKVMIIYINKYLISYTTNANQIRQSQTVVQHQRRTSTKINIVRMSTMIKWSLLCKFNLWTTRTRTSPLSSTERDKNFSSSLLIKLKVKSIRYQLFNLSTKFTTYLNMLISIIPEREIILSGDNGLFKNLD